MCLALVFSKRLNLSLQTVRRWRRRWLKFGQAMGTAEQNDDEKQLRQVLFDALSGTYSLIDPGRWKP